MTRLSYLFLEWLLGPIEVHWLFELEFVS
jgi:hypothetical protein